MYRNHSGKILQFLGVGVGSGKAEHILVFATDFSCNLGQHGEVGITLDDEEEFPLLRKGGEKCSSQAFSSSVSEQLSVSERDLNV